MATLTGQSDPNLVYGWNVQLPSSNTNTYGDAPPGYAQAGVAPVASVTAGQVSSGNIDSATGVAAGGPAGLSPILENPGYADGMNTLLGQLPAHGTGTPNDAPAITYAARVNNPSGLATLVTITGTVSNVYVGPAGVGGSGTTNLTQVGATAGTYTVPPAGVIYVVGSAGAWTWMTTN